MGIFRKTFLSLAALCVSSASHATNEWSTFTLEHGQISVRVIYPRHTSAVLLSTLANNVKSALLVVEQKNQGAFEAPFDLMFDDNPQYHNGLATVIPRDFVWVHTVAPDNHHSIGLSKDYLRSTLIHEFGHIFYLQKRRGWFSAGKTLFGNLSSPLGSWPRWMHEGWATWVEGRFDPSENAPYLNFLKRTYAEAANGPKYERLTNSMLEGTYTLDAISPGEIPYAFGFGMMTKVFEKIPPDRWAQTSADSLGISFRKNAMAQGFSMDELFSQNEADWRSARIGSADTATKEVYSQQTLYSLNSNFVLAANKDDLQVLDFTNAKKSQRFLWRHHNWFLSQLAATSDDNVVLAAYYLRPANSGAPSKLKIARMKKNLNTMRLDHLCTVFESSTEALLNLLESHASIIPRLPTGNTAPLARYVPLKQDCSNSSTHIDSDHLNLTTHGLDTTAWGVHDDSSGKLQTIGAIVSPKLANRNLCEQIFATSINWCVSGLHSSLTFRNPVIVAQTSRRQLIYKSAKVITGAQETSLTNNGLFWIEKRWKHDLLQHVEMDDLIARPTLKWLILEGPSVEAKKAPTPVNLYSSSPYSPWSTLKPHYWMPQMLASNSGLIVGGSTWFHDITRTYEGTLRLGYDTVSKYPNVSAFLKRNLSLGQWPDSLDAGFSYRRDVNLSSQIDLASTRIGISGSLNMGSSQTLSPRISLSHRWTAINGADQHFLVPSTSLAWRYLDAPTTSLNTDHSIHQLGYLIEGRFSWIKNYEIYAEISASGKLPLSWVMQLEYGNTSPKNLPHSYFQWGGYYPLQFYQGTFLSRGFAPVSATAVHIGRAALTTGWEWSNRMLGLGWSRLEIEKFTQDIFAETVFFEQAYRTSGPKLGDKLCTSVGTELNFWMRSLFYIKTRAFAGVYRGFGKGGETRVAIGLASNLDI